MLDATTTRWALRLLGIVYPGYLTYKTLEHDRKRGENQRGWCIYWAVASAWLGCVAPVLDLVFDGRVALYGESKVRTGVRAVHACVNQRLTNENSSRLRCTSGTPVSKAPCTSTIDS
jgi:hypothetical protein